MDDDLVPPTRWCLTRSTGRSPRPELEGMTGGDLPCREVTRRKMPTVVTTNCRSCWPGGTLMTAALRTTAPIAQPRPDRRRRANVRRGWLAGGRDYLTAVTCGKGEHHACAD